MFAIISRRKTWFAFSGILIFLSLLSIGTFGLNLGIDFTGGTRIQVHFLDERPTKEEVQAVFRKILGNEKGESITETLDKNDILIRSRILSDEEGTQLGTALSENFENSEIISTNTIGSSVGTVFKERALMAIAFAIGAIILFVAFAFRTVPEGYSSWKFGLATIVALAHDIVIVIGFFAAINFFLGNEIDSLFITALWTILGYSVNDTIVIFDRVRENLIHDKTGNLAKVAENSLWQAMRRSINTSFSTLLVAGTMIFFLLGFSSLFSFFLAISLGMIIGTYSSIFIATPLLVSWNTKK